MVPSQGGSFMKRAREATTEQLEALHRRVEHWRAHRDGGRSMIPEDLWNAAVEVARVAGVHATSKALRFNYYSLKDRLVRADSAALTRGSGTATRPLSRCRCSRSRRSPRASRRQTTRRSSSSWGSAVPGCGSTSPARAAWTSWASRRRSGVASDDPAHRPDAHPRRRRAGGLPPRDRRPLPTLPRGLGDGSVLGSRVRVPEPQWHGGEDPRLRRAGILALPEAPVAGTVRALAARGQRWRERPPALRARALGAPRRR